MALQASTTPPLSDSRIVTAILALCYAVMAADRTVVYTLGESIKRDLLLTDAQLGLLGGLAFAIPYALSTIPIARLSDRYSRVKILSGAVAFWSAATALCGSASGFVNLIVFRAAVGAGEAGCSPSAQSLISDYVPRARRAFAISLFYVGIPLGVFVGATLAGTLAVHYGWRAAFVVLGVPGLLLALVVLTFVKEPPRGGLDNATPSGTLPSLGAVLRTLWVTPGLRYIIAGMTMSSFVLYSFGQFLHPLFVRSFGLSYADAALAFGLIVALSSAIGSPIGGALSDRLGRRDPRWAAWLPALGLLLAAPLYIGGVLQTSWPVLCGCLFVAGITSNFLNGPSFAAVHNRIGPQMRATATAVMLFISTIVGMGFGPLLSGLASDWFASQAFVGNYALCSTEVVLATKEACAQASSAGLRLALAFVASIYLLAALMYGLAGNRLRAYDDL